VGKGMTLANTPYANKADVCLTERSMLIENTYYASVHGSED
jgi:hypothetical protein